MSNTRYFLSMPLTPVNELIVNLQKKNEETIKNLIKHIDIANGKTTKEIHEYCNSVNYSNNINQSICFLKVVTDSSAEMKQFTDISLPFAHEKMLRTKIKIENIERVDIDIERLSYLLDEDKIELAKNGFPNPLFKKAEEKPQSQASQGIFKTRTVLTLETSEIPDTNFKMG